MRPSRVVTSSLSLSRLQGHHVSVLFNFGHDGVLAVFGLPLRANAVTNASSWS